MSPSTSPQRLLLFLFLLLLVLEPLPLEGQRKQGEQLSPSTPGKATWAYTDSTGHLQYKTTPAGDRILDFSSVGYKSGRVPLPSALVPNKVVLKPLGNGADDTSQIQKAINQVASLPLNSNGFRGAVLLSPGTFTVQGSLVVNASGVVLRGSGTDESSGTTLLAVGTGRTFVTLTGSGRASLGSQKWSIAASYIPSGATQLKLASASGLSPGTSIMIVSTITSKFIHALGMDQLVRDGQKQTWIAAGTKVYTDRVVQSVAGNVITLDAPFPESVNASLFDSSADAPYIVKYTWSGRLQNAAVENLRGVVAKPQFVPPGDTSWTFVEIQSAINCWVNDLYSRDFDDGVVNTVSNTKWITASNIYSKFTITGSRTPYPGDFSICGTQNLLINVTDLGCSLNFPLWTPTLCRGPIVFTNILIDPQGRLHVNIQPHMRWSTGLLFDNVTLVESANDPSGGNSAVLNRHNMGSGHGWAGGWSVLWNVNSKTLTAENPAPVALNWIVGGQGKNVPNPDFPNDGLCGTYDSVGVPVNNPPSLYQAQVRQRPPAI